MLNNYFYKKIIILITFFVFVFGFNVYGSDKEITRAELAVYAVHTYEETVQSGIRGLIVDGDPFYTYIDLEGCQPLEYQAIYNAKCYGFMSGMTDKIFSPHDIATREQIAVVLYRMINRVKYRFEHDKKLESKGLLNEQDQFIRYGDKEQVSDWARQAIDFMLSKQIFELEEQKFNPQKGMSKEDVKETMILVQNMICDNYGITIIHFPPSLTLPFEPTAQEQ